MVKLNLGCGTKKIPGFVNIDIRADVHPDIVDDITQLSKVENNSADLIYACHVLEHVNRNSYKSVLSRWFDVLKHNGKIRIAVPDFEAVVKQYTQGLPISSLIGFLYGRQDHAFNYHFYTWDFESLKQDLESVGFSNVTRYNWRHTEHCGIDDYSQSYLPHMDKDNGVLMSLNVEGTK